MLKSSNIFIILLWSFFTFSATASECKLYNTRYIMDKISKVSKENICVSLNERISVASSKNCQMLMHPECPFKAITKGPPIESFIKEMGSPGFHLCHKLGGSPQLYEIEVKEKWMPFERCYWKNSKEFANIDDLIGLYKSL